MAVGDLNIALILKLVDKVTAPSRAVLGTLRRIAGAAEETGRAGVAWSNEQIAANNARRSALMGEAFGVAALAGSMAAALRPAIEFETSMAGVSKVLDFDTPDGLKMLEKDILRLTTNDQLPMLAGDIADIIEAAGQAGVVDKALPDAEERAQLIAFARDAAQMGVAFNISADQAGTAMAQWRAAMRLSQDQSLRLGDAINYLSNNMNASAPGLVDVIRRQGAVAMSAGLAEVEVAALAAAFLSGGASPEIAATALKNFTGALTDGEAMTARQSKVMAQLGFDAEELAKRMQVDARGAIVDVMEALAELPAHAQGAALSQLFGEESKGAIAPLLTNLDLLRGAFKLVENEGSYSGSMLEEYAKQSETTANALKVTQNYLSAMAITIGSILLPEINELLASIQPVLSAIREWAAEHPELISLIFKLTAGFLVFKLGSIGLRFVLFSLLSPFLHLIRGASWLLVLLGHLGGALRALASVKALRWASIIPRLAWGAFITPIRWVALAGKLAWRALIAPLVWTQALVSKIPWMRLAVSGKPFALRALVTALKWGTRLIPVIGWALLAGQLIWSALIKPLGWDKYLPKVDWARVFGAFSWDGWIPEIDWDRIIGSISWPEPPRWLKWLMGEEETGAISMTKSAGFGALPSDQQAAIRSLENVAGAGELPTAKYMAELQEHAAALQAEIASVQAGIDAMAEGPMKSTLVAPMQAEMSALQEELTWVQTEMVAADQRAAELTAALMVINDTDVRPDIDTASIDAALVKAQKLSSILRNASGAAAVTSGLPEGARDRGGPVRAGMPYLVGERFPEIFVPGVAGTILPSRVLKSAMAASAMAAPAAAMPSSSDLIQTLDRRPTVSTPAPAPQVTRQGDTINITIAPPPGTDEQMIVQLLRRELDRRQDDRRADLHDGVDYDGGAY